jgi:hypothetical protein
MLLGLKNVFYAYPYPPVGAVEKASYYGFSLALVSVGLWLCLRGRPDAI